MSVNQLAGVLVGRYSGPILVVGGAPCMPADLEVLKAGGFKLDECIIVSANEHAVYAGLHPHFAVVNDDTHAQLQVRQEPRMRKLMPDTLLLSRHWWADYRTPQLMACNSGLKALLYAALLGGNPIIAIGFDHYRGEKLYFHATEPSIKGNPNQQRDMPHFTQQTDRVKAALGEVPVRTVSGPLTKVWPVWRPDEQFAARELSKLEVDAKQQAQRPCYACAMLPGGGFEGALLPEGMIFAVTERELRDLVASGSFADATKWDLSDPASDRLRFMEAKRVEQARLLDMIAKVRNHPRSVRRGIHDGDLIRIIKWTEAGTSVENIARQTGLPKQQVTFLVTVMGARDLTPAA